MIVKYEVEVHLSDDEFDGRKLKSQTGRDVTLVKNAVNITEVMQHALRNEYGPGVTMFVNVTDVEFAPAG